MLLKSVFTDVDVVLLASHRADSGPTSSFDGHLDLASKLKSDILGREEEADEYLTIASRHLFKSCLSFSGGIGVRQCFFDRPHSCASISIR